VTPRALADVACRAVEAAAAVLREARHAPRRIRRKSAVDLVTDADLAAEAAVLAVIRDACPDDAVMTEESGYLDGSSPRRWIVDPLDGTTNFAHGHPHVAVSVAVEVDGEILGGAIADPFRHELFRAARGDGAWLNGVRLAVSTVGSLDQALVATGFPYDRREIPARYLAFVERVLRSCQGIRRGGSAALDLAWLAAGRLDAFWEWKLAPWDVAAGRLLVTEAGGGVTAADGSPHTLVGPSTVASNGLVHADLLHTLAWNGTPP
jgi:myo-inositol-1(or 4)-monophosphatase